ncbi:MAG: glucose-6-phosphate dehydrogenase assembly protein OpcA [Chlamydiales bacterium]|nr:glucose-6-phosphate dehydrogenase assembly protein OpcA [Chlamydiales bacterium]
MPGETPVKTSEIQSTLTRIWNDLDGTNKMRACLFNLIFYTESGQRADYIREIAHKVVEKFPSRIIFISSDKNAPVGSLSAKVSVITATTGESDVACDLIEIDVAKSEHSRVPFVILPHILPDLPVYFLWGEDPKIDDPIFKEISKFSTRIIFDSEASEALPPFAKSLLHQYTVLHNDVADLNWARIENWRDVLSTTFCTPNKLAHLENASEISISFNAASSTFFCHTNIQALYLQAWIAGQLNWSLTKTEKQKETLKFTYNKASGPVTVLLSPAQCANLAPGMVSSFDLSTNDQFHYNYACHPDQPHKIVLNFSTHELCEMPSEFLFQKGEKGQSLVKEICHRGMSSHYLKVLEQICKIDVRLLC